MFRLQEAEALFTRETRAWAWRVLIAVPIMLAVCWWSWNYGLATLAKMPAWEASGVAPAVLMLRRIKIYVLLACVTIMALISPLALISVILRLPRLSLSVEEMRIRSLRGTRAYSWHSLGPFYIHVMQIRRKTMRYLVCKAAGPLANPRDLRRGYISLSPVRDGAELVSALNMCRDQCLGLRAGSTKTVPIRKAGTRRKINKFWLIFACLRFLLGLLMLSLGIVTLFILCSQKGEARISTGHALFPLLLGVGLLWSAWRTFRLSRNQSY